MMLGCHSFNRTLIRTAITGYIIVFDVRIPSALQALRVRELYGCSVSLFWTQINRTSHFMCRSYSCKPKRKAATDGRRDRKVRNKNTRRRYSKNRFHCIHCTRVCVREIHERDWTRPQARRDPQCLVSLLVVTYRTTLLSLSKAR